MTKNFPWSDRLLPTIGVGSYATPGWMFPFRRAMRDGGLGEADIAEAFDDATRIVIADQVDAGVDIISDGELRRQRFVYEMYDRIEGIERIPPGRRLGVPGYDMAPAFVANARVAAPSGLGLVEEYKGLVELAPMGPILKMALPGPLTFAGNIQPGDAYADSGDLLEDIVALVQAEVEALAAAGVPIIQLDEPGLPHPPLGLDHIDAAAAINRALQGIEVPTAVHVCFGNNASRPFALRSFDRLMPGLEALDCDILMLEFANREMADIESLSGLSGKFHIAAGVIDVKNFYVESAEDVAERLRRILNHMPAERLLVTSDCGFSAIPRWLAREKMRAMTAGAALVRAELSS